MTKVKYPVTKSSKGFQKSSEGGNKGEKRGREAKKQGISTPLKDMAVRPNVRGEEAGKTKKHLLREDGRTAVSITTRGANL